MANYKIHNIPFTKLYLTNGGTNPNLNTLNNGGFKGLGTDFVSSTYLIERPFQNFLYLNNGADISPYFSANISNYTTPGSFSISTLAATPNVYFKHANFMVIGGGGGGGAGGGGSSQPDSGHNSDPGGAGGHGQFQAWFNYPLFGVTELNGSVGGGGAGGLGRFKDNGNPGENGGLSTITNILSSVGGGGGGGGNKADNPGTASVGSTNLYIDFSLFGNNPTNPLMIYPNPPNVLSVDSVLPTQFFASSVLTGNGGAGGGSTYNSASPLVPSTGLTGTGGNPGRVVIYWLYDSRQRIIKPTIWVDAYSGTKINYGKTSWDSNLTISGSGLSGYFTNGSSSNVMTPPMVFAYVIVYTFQTYSQYISFFQTLSNTNYLFLNDGTEFDAEFDAFGGASGFQLNRTYDYYVNGVNTRRTRTQNNRQIVVVTLDSSVDFTAFPHNIVKIQNDGFLAFSGNKIHEFMLFDYDITTEINGFSYRQYIEGHLASKWKITLPTDHPFYDKSNIMYFE